MTINDKIIISLSDLSIGYKNRFSFSTIVKSKISLYALKGELVALIGSNGSGKSTLLKTIIGFQPALEGQITINDRPATSYNERQLSKTLSFVSTEQVRVPNLTVYDLVALGRYPYTNWFGKLLPADHQVVEEAIFMTGLEGYENRLINFLSDGERQKAMIARTLAQDTEIIVLDEPTAFMDLSNKYEIVHILRNLAIEKGKTILYSTHDLSTAIAESDRIWLMLENSVEQGSPEDLVISGSFNSLFKNSHLNFDTEKGDFRIRKIPIRRIGLTGAGTVCSWTAKALERIGFEVINIQDQNFENIQVEVIYPEWRLTFGDQTFIFSQLLSLCRFLTTFLYDKS